MKIKSECKCINWLNKYSILAMLIAYFLLTLAFTFPLIEKFNSQIPEGRADTFQALSNIDSRVSSFAELHGTGSRLMFLAKNINTFLPYVLLNLVLNKYASYNLLFLMSFVLSGIGMYFLAFYFTKNKIAAFLAGLIFAFSPFHFYEATVVNLGTMQQQWLPFFVLFLFKFFEQFKFKFYAATVFFAFMIALEEHQFLAFTVLFVAIFIIYKIIEDKRIIFNKRLWTYFAGSILLLAIVAFGMFGQLLKVATSENNFLDAGMSAANKYSMPFLAPFAPPTFHSIWPKANAFLQGFILGDSKSRSSYFIGYIVLLVLGFFAHTIYRKSKYSHEVKTPNLNRSFLSFWTLEIAVFYLFSLGPSLSIGKYTIYLPYYLVYKFLPFYENIRTTGRMFVFVLLGICILFAYGYVEVLKHYKHKKNMLVGATFLLLMLEFWVAPIKMMSVSHSPFYDQLRQDNQNYKLIEIPGSTSYNFASYALYTDNVHKKQVLNGMPLARKIRKQFAMQQNTPVIKQLLFTIPKGNDPDAKDASDVLPAFDYTQSNDLLSYYGVRYITISKLYAGKDVVKLSQQFIEKHISYTEKYEDKYLIAYEIKQTQPSGFFTQLNYEDGDKYSADFIGKDGTTYREMGDGAGLKIVNMTAIPLNVKITVSVKGLNGTVFSSPVDTKKGNAVLSDNTTGQYAFFVNLKPGDNIIPFSIRNEQGGIVTISKSKKKPTGALVSQISIQAQEINK